MPLSLQLAALIIEKRCSHCFPAWLTASVDSATWPYDPIYYLYKNSAMTAWRLGNFGLQTPDGLALQTTCRRAHLPTCPPADAFTCRRAHLPTGSPADGLTFRRAHLPTGSPADVPTCRRVHLPLNLLCCVTTCLTKHLTDQLTCR